MRTSWLTKVAVDLIDKILVVTVKPYTEDGKPGNRCRIKSFELVLL